MSMTADSSTNNNSPRFPINPTDGVDSPQSRRRGLPSPWAQVVRGEPEAISVVRRSPSQSPPIAAPEQATFSDCSGLKSRSLSPPGISAVETQLESSDSGNGNVGSTKKPAWNKPLNGVVGAGPVMGAVSWPALSECTRPLPKSSADSSKAISDGSVSISQGPVVSHSPKKKANTNANPNFTPNHTQPFRQRSIKRGGGTGGGSVRSGFSWTLPPPPPPPLPPPFPVFEIPYGSLVPPMLDSSVIPYKGNNWETRPMGGVGSRSHSVNDHSSQRSSSRRGNFGLRPRGDGFYHKGYGGKRDKDRDWNSPRNSTARDAHIPHEMAPPPPPFRGFIRPPPPGSTPFITPQPVRPFGNPMGVDMAAPFFYVPSLLPESFRGLPPIAHAPPPAMFIPVMDPPLAALLVNQIEYYFSDANLVKDRYLRSNMDNQGWVSITLIANFPRVQNLTNNKHLILDSLRTSTVVEVQGDKVRRRNEWRKWIPISDRFPIDSGLQSPSGSTDSMLATSFQKVELDEVTTNQNSTIGTVDVHAEVVLDRFSTEELTGHTRLANGGEGIAEEACSSHI